MNLRPFIIVFTTLISACSISLKDQNNELVSNLEGNWDEVHENACAEGFRTIKFSDDGKRLFITFSDVGYIQGDESRKIFKYKILDYSSDRIRMLLEDEPRLDSAENPVVWHLVAKSKNTYCWGRDDWPLGSCTPARYRCET